MDFTMSKQELLSSATLKHLAKPLHVVLNRTSGSKQGGNMHDQLLMPLFQELSLPYTLHDEKPSSSSIKDQEATVIVVGGDGTLGDLMECLPASNLPRFDIVLLPFGTANAFYHFLFPPPNENLYLSLRHFLAGEPSKPLALASVESKNLQKLANVVVSTAFHASILYEADRLRGQVEGIERFKVAAQKSWGRFWAGKLSMKGVKRYDLKTGAFKEEKDEELESQEWMYLNVCLTDRLEREFVIAPRREVESEGLDVVTIRKPPTVQSDLFWQGMQGVFAAAYQNGKHVDLTWKEDGSVEEKGNGSAVVDYYRVETIEWTPNLGAEEQGRLLCIDGALEPLQDTVRISRFPNDRVKVHA